jgi:uncharacterized membrane protein
VKRSTKVNIPPFLQLGRATTRWTVLIAMASVGVAIFLMFLWFIASLLFR